jgi:predicted nucleotidyltransferase
MQLVEAQLVVREEMRRGPEYRAPFEDPRLKGLFLMLRQDSEIVAALKQALRKTKYVSYACIFGSFAAGTTHKGSDIDVLIIERAGLDRFEFQITLGKVADRFGRPVNPEFYSAEEFSRKLASLDPVVLSILENPRIELKGATPWQT